MSASSTAPISFSDNLPLTSILSEGDIYRGKLADIIEPDGQDIILADIAGDLIEVPKAQSSALWSMVGWRIWLACIGGKIRFAVVTAS